ncbi:hypothetical protein KP509_03G049300 [Ceratopteris richardii]|uniref:IST1-like protein n=1 Tax=Ceratopteris richardii TaxID=49495 RepID=A0A8T2V784_CERRI|nr:hypothetical protein KP509_03G049300 [Ceratopteris richardii]
MLRSVFGKSFNAGKCKTLLRLAISRIKLLRNKRDMQLRQMRRELGQLLQAKQDLTARIRVEHVFREQNIMAAYEIIELFCELLVVRLPILESQRQCPMDLREAIASIIFAAPRCADLPELQNLSSLFGFKYGKDFVAAAAELRPDCGVNRLVIEKLSVRAPTDIVRLKLMKEIAEEQGVDWDATGAEAELCKDSQDSLDEKGEGIAFTLPDPPSGCLKQSTSPREKETNSEQEERDRSYKDAADAARMAALSAERASAAAMAVASLAKEHFVRVPNDQRSQRSASEYSSTTDEDEYNNETEVKRNLANSREYFPIKMDCFDAHLDDAQQDVKTEGSSARMPIFDEYPEPKLRFERGAERGGNRKQAMPEEFSSDEDGSRSAERRVSPLYRSRMESHQSSKQTTYDKNSCYFGSDGSRQRTISPDDDDNDDGGFDWHENSGVHRGIARTRTAPPQRPPPGLDDADNYYCSAAHVRHVHPKLPDIDDLSARFRALKSKN